jgi:hypothetical protein
MTEVTLIIHNLIHIILASPEKMKAEREMLLESIEQKQRQEEFNKHMEEEEDK